VAVLSSGSATGFARAALAGSPGPARLLGSFPTACYLELGSGEVIAVLTSDAVQLPIGLTLPWPSSRLDLPSVVRGGQPAVRPGEPAELRLGRLRVAVTGRRDARLRYCGRPSEFPAVSDVWSWLPDGRLDPFGNPTAAAAGLLGRGPGLTPAGDDLLCGALAAGVLFGIPVTRLAEAVRDRLAGELITTGLSRQLLSRALAGDGLPELQQLAEAMCSRDGVEQACRRLLRIGHSSGAALAAGLLAGARHAVATRPAAA
jgi:Protein of unknown function (DUF2877)